MLGWPTTTNLEALADAIIAAGWRLRTDTIMEFSWRPRIEWLMGAGGTGGHVADDAPSYEIVTREAPYPTRWQAFVKGLTYEQANAIVVQHNRAVNFSVSFSVEE